VKDKDAMVEIKMAKLIEPFSTDSFDRLIGYYPKFGRVFYSI
jgi:hypothetical protein